MGSVIEETVKALIEFEAKLDGAKSEASEARKKLLRDAADRAEEAKARALSRAQRVASDRLTRAKSQAEKEAESIREKGGVSLRAFEASISRRRSKAADHVVARLLGVEA